MNDLERIDISYFICKDIEGLSEKLKQKELYYVKNKDYIIVLTHSRIKKLLHSFGVSEAVLVNVEFMDQDIRVACCIDQSTFYDFKYNIITPCNNIDEALKLLDFNAKKYSWNFLNLSQYRTIDIFINIAQEQLENYKI